MPFNSTAQQITDLFRVSDCFQTESRRSCLPMSQVRSESYSVEDDPDLDIPLEPDDNDSEERMNFERTRYAPILVELEELEAALMRAEDETERELHSEEVGIDEDIYLL